MVRIEAITSIDESLLDSTRDSYAMVFGALTDHIEDAFIKLGHRNSVDSKRLCWSELSIKPKHGPSIEVRTEREDGQEAVAYCLARAKRTFVRQWRDKAPWADNVRERFSQSA